MTINHLSVKYFFHNIFIFSFWLEKKLLKSVTTKLPEEVF